MSYLLENSLVITKKEYKDNEEKYLTYESYPIDDRLILTENEKPFFSIYDIAKFAKNKYPKNKLFLIAHRYYNNVLKEMTTEFYIFNTVDIFEKSLTSFLTINLNELSSKQHVIQNNIKIAKIMANCDDLHIILGDNIMLHEVVEYISHKKHSSKIDIFESTVTNEIYEEDTNNKEFQVPSNITHSNISYILGSIRVIEPKSVKLKNIAILAISVVLAFAISQDISDSLFDDYKYSLKKENKILRQDLNRVKQNYYKKEKFSKSFVKKLQKLTKKDIYKLENK